MMDALRKENLNRWIAYFTLCCLVFASQKPSRLMADPCPCVLVEPEDACRTRTAKIVAGATVIALVGGVAWLALGSSCHKGHSHSSSSHHHHSHSYDYDPPFPSYSYSNSGDSYGGHHHHGHRDHHHHHKHSSDYSSGSGFWTGSGSGYHSLSDPQIFERDAEGNLPARSRQIASSKKAKSANEISGVFMTHPSLSSASKGSVTAFVQMPDGTTQVLGSLPISVGRSSSLAYGPFTQKGNYLFGIRVDEGTNLSSQSKIGSVEVNVNGSIVENRDFYLPAHSPSHYEPAPCEYCL